MRIFATGFGEFSSSWLISERLANCTEDSSEWSNSLATGSKQRFAPIISLKKDYFKA